MSRPRNDKERKIKEDNKNFRRNIGLSIRLTKIFVNQPGQQYINSSEHFSDEEIFRIFVRNLDRVETMFDESEADSPQ